MVQEGRVTFTAGNEIIEASGGQVVVPTGVAHKSVNSGTGRLRQVDIHVNERFITEWLEGWAGLQDKGDGLTTSPCLALYFLPWPEATIHRSNMVTGPT